MMACSICSSKGNDVTRTVFYIVTRNIKPVEETMCFSIECLVR